MIKIGPSGIGGKKDIIDNLRKYHSLGVRVSEITFTYGIYIDEDFAKEIGEELTKLDMEISIHAPYYINLNSKDKEKIIASKKRILDCCEIGHILSHGRKKKTSIVFHSGFYSDMDKEKAFENIKNEILNLMEEVDKNKWNIILCPEIMGKRNVFGSIEEIHKLINETKCGCCIDFAHILARYDSNQFNLVKEKFGNMKNWHCHFSGINYGDKGEKNHKQTTNEEWEGLFKFLTKLNIDINIISEAPEPLDDAVNAIKILKYF